MELFPRRQHIDDASQLQHKQGNDIERIFVARIKHIDRPHIDEAHVIAAQHRLLVHTMEMATQANVLFHPQYVADDGHVVLGIQGLGVRLAAHREHHLIGGAELVGLVWRRFTGINIYIVYLL